MRSASHQQRTLSSSRRTSGVSGDQRLPARRTPQTVAGSASSIMAGSTTTGTSLQNRSHESVYSARVRSAIS
ncbi:MAG: hypothetical protein NZU74_10555 [Chloroflexaceae bacterium]|nr:hypothetical protein [Chloroflexaceae bacterium]